LLLKTLAVSARFFSDNDQNDQQNDAADQKSVEYAHFSPLLFQSAVIR